MVADLERLLHEIGEYLSEDCIAVYFPKIVDKPKGVRQSSDLELFDHEYVDQHSGIGEDDYYGTMYFPLPSGKYLSVDYNC